MSIYTDKFKKEVEERIAKKEEDYLKYKIERNNELISLAQHADEQLKKKRRYRNQ